MYFPWEGFYKMPNAKEIIYKTLYRSGVQRLFSYFNRHKLSIICFHSISVQDEHEFWPGVFISKEKLIQVLDYLQDSRYQVITLAEAKRHLKGEVKYDYPVVITIDDGWYRSVVDMLPILAQYNFPSTMYVTTYYVNHRIPVVNVLIQYMLWKSNTTAFRIEIDGESHHFTGTAVEIVRQVEDFLKGKTEQEITQFLYAAADALNVDREVIDQKLFHNADYDDLRQAHQSPLVDLQLHTHVHNLPNEKEQLEHQIVRNKALMEQALDCRNELNDFCYPSGIWHPAQIPHLEELGIETATTLDEGLNKIGGHTLKLRRNLVMNNGSLLHVKMALSGTFDSVRGLKGALKAGSY